jgi:hypothetical protein
LYCPDIDPIACHDCMSNPNSPYREPAGAGPAPPAPGNDASYDPYAGGNAGAEAPPQPAPAPAPAAGGDVAAMCTDFCPDIDPIACQDCMHNPDSPYRVKPAAGGAASNGAGVEPAGGAGYDYPMNPRKLIQV